MSEQGEELQAAGRCMALITLRGAWRKPDGMGREGESRRRDGNLYGRQ